LFNEVSASESSIQVRKPGKERRGRQTGLQSNPQTMRDRAVKTRPARWVVVAQKWWGMKVDTGIDIKEVSGVTLAHVTQPEAGRNGGWTLRLPLTWGTEKGGIKKREDKK